MHTQITSPESIPSNDPSAELLDYTLNIEVEKKESNNP